MKYAVLIFAIGLSGATFADDIERINPAGMTQPTAYTHLVKHGDTLYIAGQVSLDAEGNVVGRGDIVAQFRQAMENLKTILASEGADFSNIVKTTIFTTNIDEFRKVGPVRAEYFGDHAPASTLVQIERLARPVFMVEIEAVAIKHDLSPESGSE